MSIVCHECSGNVENPFYEFSAALWDRRNQRLAVSNRGVYICAGEYNRVAGELQDDSNKVGSPLCYTIDTVCGGVSPLMGTVQFSYGVEQAFSYKFLSRETGQRALRNSARYVDEGIAWMEKSDGKFVKAEWAPAFYRRVVRGPEK